MFLKALFCCFVQVIAVKLDNQRVGIAPSIPHWTTGDGAINIAITNAGPLAH